MPIYYSDETEDTALGDVWQEADDVAGEPIDLTRSVSYLFTLWAVEPIEDETHKFLGRSSGGTTWNWFEDPQALLGGSLMPCALAINQDGSGLTVAYASSDLLFFLQKPLVVAPEVVNAQLADLIAEGIITPETLEYTAWNRMSEEHGVPWRIVQPLTQNLNGKRSLVQIKLVG